MSHIYIHIPFCRSKCHYCDFFSQASLKYKNDFLYALKTEIEVSKDYLSTKNIDTIYFGGGTPSVLNISEIKEILECIQFFYHINDKAEITFEVNPEDVSLNYSKDLIATGINRVSIGVQSLDNDFLRIMNRRHDSARAFEALDYVRSSGINNISVDLIYGINGLSPELWEENLITVCSVKPEHLSAYHLAIEPKTTFGVLQKRGLKFLSNEDDSIFQFEKLIDITESYGYNHYEVSNFSLKNYESQHNSSYWNMEEYLGMGPSAHSYNGFSRRWNINSVSGYINKLKNKEGISEHEEISETMRINEFFLTKLRTCKGIFLNEVEEKFGNYMVDFIKNKAHKHIIEGLIIDDKGNYYLSRKGILKADMIIEDFFII